MPLMAAIISLPPAWRSWNVAVVQVLGQPNREFLDLPRQVPHLRRHHHKAPGGIAGPRRLDRRVQRHHDDLPGNTVQILPPAAQLTVLGHHGDHVLVPALERGRQDLQIGGLLGQLIHPSQQLGVACRAAGFLLHHVLDLRPNSGRPIAAR